MNRTSRTGSWYWVAGLACGFLIAASLAWWTGAREAQRINRNRDLVVAVENEDISGVKRLLAAGADPNTCNDYSEEHVRSWQGCKHWAARALHRPVQEPKGHLVGAIALEKSND